ncbi:putative ankyrin repeat protein [Rosellinia necatrix]|uniref:Putative ankyrin repeat protein n=1 Tax=Rosellinia necatrix TaxID=77044 RepID=A0A1S8A4U7_ROSNE|nr:putative ankyrin repeat protein [Rosellinia necatrix]
MKKLPSFIERSPQLKAEITAVIAAAVGGMFILAQLYLRLLEDKTTERTVRKTINQFQKQTSESSEVQKLKALGQAYDQTMDRINKQKQGLKELANNVLTWVAFAERPLTTEQLQHALAVEDGEPELGEDNFPEIAVMVSVCAGLVTVDERNIVRLVHYTTQEYFERTKKQWFPRAETYITNTCINYISLTTFAVGDDRKWSEIINRGRIDCLYLYAIKKWGNHARKDSKLNPKVVEFLESRVRPEFKMQVGAEDVLFSHKEFNPPPSVGSGLHLAAYFGLDNTVRALISRGHRPDKVDALNRTPLSWAAANVFGKSTVEMPTQRSVGAGGMSESDLSGRDRFTIQGPTPPVWETINTHKKIAQILLDTGKINPESKDRYG